jgi:glutamate transport system permease protein
VLFDLPGPRARIRHAVLTVLGLVVAAGLAVLVLIKMHQTSQLDPQKWTPFLSVEVWRAYLVPGLRGTFVAAAISIVLALAFGVLFGVGRLSSLRVIRWPSSVVVEFFRAVPVLIMMIFVFGVYARYGVFPVEYNPLAGVVTALTLYNGSVIAELVRSGVLNLPKGQSEASSSLGLSWMQTMRSVQLPQALTAMLPALVGQLVVILKDSALGYTITYLELLSWSRNLGSAYANTVPAYLVAAVLFILINYALGRLAERVQGRVARRR